MKFCCCFSLACGLPRTSGNRLMVSASSIGNAARAAASPITTCGNQHVSRSVGDAPAACRPLLRWGKPQQLNVPVAIRDGKDSAAVLLRRADQRREQQSTDGSEFAEDSLHKCTENETLPKGHGRPSEALALISSGRASAWICAFTQSETQTPDTHTPALALAEKSPEMCG